MIAAVFLYPCDDAQSAIQYFNVESWILEYVSQYFFRTGGR